MTMVLARVQDASTFYQFHELLVEYERSLPIELRHGAEPDLAFVRDAYGEPNAAFTAIIGDIAVGCVAVTRYDGFTAIVQRLYVRPDYRERGMGRALVAVVLDFCRDRTYERVVLDTERECLPAAYCLYTSLGFSDCEPYGPVTYPNPTFMQFHLGSLRDDGSKRAMSDLR